MSGLAEEAGFILATPKGSGNEEVLGWNAGESNGTFVQRELACNPEKGKKVSRASSMTSGHWGKRIYGRERWEKKLGDGEPGAGADALGGGGGRCAGVRG
jgi:hypothetical protein